MIDLDLTGMNETDLEGRSKIPTGWYLAEVILTSTHQETGALQVHWRLLTPPWDGAVLIDKFNLPSLAQTVKAADGQRQRLGLFFYRMGLIPASKMGKKVSVDQSNLVGLKRVLSVTRGPAKDAPVGSPEYSNVDYGCYYTLDRPEIPVDERMRLGLPLLPGQSESTDPKNVQQSRKPKKPAQQDVKTQEEPSTAFDPSEI